jgi:hypothetical protein
VFAQALSKLSVTIACLYQTWAADAICQPFSFDELDVHQGAAGQLKVW